MRGPLAGSSGNGASGDRSGPGACTLLLASRLRRPRQRPQVPIECNVTGFRPAQFKPGCSGSATANSTTQSAMHTPSTIRRRSRESAATPCKGEKHVTDPGACVMRAHCIRRRHSREKHFGKRRHARSIAGENGGTKSRGRTRARGSRAARAARSQCCVRPARPTHRIGTAAIAGEIAPACGGINKKNVTHTSMLGPLCPP